MMLPFHCTANRVPLSVQEHTHRARASVARDQEFVFARYDDDIRVRLEV